MKGTVSTLQKCELCKKKFEGKNEDGFYCKEHPYVRPTRYIISVKYFGIPNLLYSTPAGVVLDSYHTANALLQKIRTEWDESRRGGKTFDPDNYIHVKIKSKKVNELIEKFIKSKERRYRKKKLSQSYWQQVNNICNKFIKPHFGNKFIESITEDDIEDFYHYLEDATYINKRKEEEYYSTKHIKDIMMMFRSLFKFAKTEIPPYPDGWSKIEPKRKKQILSVDAQMAIAPYIPDIYGYRIAINILQNTAMRVCEVRALSASDVTERGVLVSKSLTDRLRTTRKGYAPDKFYVLPKYIIDDLMDHIKSKTPDDLVFTIKGNKGFCLSTLRNVWNRAVKKAGLPRMEFNQACRHTWASREMQQAKDAASRRIQDQLGHSNPKTQSHYIVEE